MAPRPIKCRAARNAKPEENKQQLVNMPLDVLIEIFPYLEPLDLLHLARTTKGFRAFLLSRNKCSTLWKSVISNVDGFPACPDHISAPAYTHLAFVPVCHWCFGPCETIEWGLRMRCCPICWDDMTVSYPHPVDLPFSKTTPHPRPVYPPYIHIFRVTLPTISRHATLVDNNSQVIVTTDCFPSVCSRLDWATETSCTRPKGVPMDEFVAERNAFWDSIRNHARLCRDWHEEKLRVKALQLTLVKNQRIRDIKHKLSELGWTTSNLSEFSHWPQVKKLEPLTPAEWTKIKPRLVRRLEKAKEKTIWHDRIDKFRSAIQSIQEEVIKDSVVKVKPESIDIAMLPVVGSMLESSVHSDFTLDDAKKKLSRVVPQAIRKWSLDAVEELKSFAREQLNLSPLSKPSDLPSIIFRCKQCSERLTFDEALSHLHLYKERWIKKRNTSKMTIHERLVMEYTRPPRDIDVLQIDVGVCRKVENLIRRMGKNPSRVTYDEMCRSPVKVACSLCRLPTNMDFKTAFDHCLITHFRKKENEMWTRISARKIVETSMTSSSVSRS